jgi:hypothetical protein
LATVVSFPSTCAWNVHPVSKEQPERQRRVRHLHHSERIQPDTPLVAVDLGNSIVLPHAHDGPLRVVRRISLITAQLEMTTGGQYEGTNLARTLRLDASTMTRSSWLSLLRPT